MPYCRLSVPGLYASTKGLGVDQTPGSQISGGLSHSQVMLLEALGHIFGATDVVPAIPLALQNIDCRHKEEIGGAGAPTQSGEPPSASMPLKRSPR